MPRKNFHSWVCMFKTAPKKNLKALSIVLGQGKTEWWLVRFKSPIYEKYYPICQSMAFCFCFTLAKYYHFSQIWSCLFELNLLFSSSVEDLNSKIFLCNTMHQNNFLLQVMKAGFLLPLELSFEIVLTFVYENNLKWMLNTNFATVPLKVFYGFFN